jgi:DNA primase
MQGAWNVLDFVAAMEKSSVRDAAMKPQEWFGIDPATAPTESKPDQKPAKSQRREDEKREEGSEPVNKPLAFELKGIDYAHPYLKERGITNETAETFGVGLFAGRGSMNGRVVIPIHNERGELVAYAGRSIDGSEPRYKLPAGFHKSHVLLNLHRASSKTAGSEVVVVEGFFDCMKVWQSGHSSVVALMGSSLSEQQERLLLDRFKQVTLFLDGDEAGRSAADEIAARLIRQMHVRIVELPVGKQPDELDQEQLRALLG